MPKGGKMFDAIMISIIIIAALNYADYIKVDTKLMMVLVTIALYVTAKQTQKSQKINKTSKKVEPLDGSTVAFDKEAFVNLNNIVNELVKKDSVTIPGNLIVKGTTTMEKDLNVKAHATVDGTTICNGAFTCEGVSSFKMKDKVYSHINWTDGTCYIRGSILLDAAGGTNANVHCHDVHARNSVIAKNDISASSSVSAGQNLIVGGATTLKGTLNAKSTTLSSVTVSGTLRVDGATVLKGTLNAHGQVTCNNTALASLSVNGRVSCGDLYTNVVDTDVIRGHAWANDRVNTIRVEDKFTLMHDSAACLSFGGYYHDSADEYRWPDVHLLGGRYKNGNRSNVHVTAKWDPWDDVSKVAHKDKNMRTHW